MSQPEGLDRPPYLRFLPRFLFSADGHPAAYIVKAWLLALLPSLALAAAVGSVAPPGTQTPDIEVQGSMPLLLLIVIGPFLETLILAVMALVLNRLVGAGPAVVLCAILWGIAHSFGAPVWGLIVWWPFLIFSVALLAWRGRGILLAIVVVTVIHGLQNATAGLLLLASGQAG